MGYGKTEIQYPDCSAEWLGKLFAAAEEKSEMAGLVFSLFKDMNSQDKGKRFEREIAKTLNKKFGSNVRRTPNSGGLSIKGDIMDTQGILSEWSFECKNQEKLNIWKAFDQAANDSAGTRRTPIVVFTKNHDRTLACLEFEDWMNLVKELEELR